MKCLKMNIADVLLFIANLIAIYSLNVHDIVPSTHSTTLVSERLLKFDKDCPQLSKIMHDNNVTDHAIDCKMLDIKTDVNEENLPQQLCYIVQETLSIMCEKKLKVTNDLFKPDKVHFVCPLNFSHLQQQLAHEFNNNEFVKNLANKDECSKLCYDSRSVRHQCVVLNHLINYFSQLPAQQVEELDRLSTVHKQIQLTLLNTENSIVKAKAKLAQQEEVHLEVDKPTRPEHTKVIPQNIENSIVSKKQGKEKYLPTSKTKEIISESKNQTTFNKVVGADNNITKSTNEQKTEKITSTPNEEEVLKSDVKLSESGNSLTGDEEFKSELDDQNEDMPSEGGVVGLMDDSLPERGKVDRISTLSPKGKEIYPAEGFFQAEDSHFFFYFIMVSSVIVVCYLAFHNKNKILAYALEGTSGRRNRRRPNRARYRKLETNLEEVISSNTTSSAVSSVVY